MAGNSLKKNDNNIKSKKDVDFKAEPKTKKTTNSLPFYKDVRFRRIVGIVFLLMAIFFTVAFFSYFTTWQQDQSKLIGSPNLIAFLKEKIAIANTAGKLGALTSHQLMYNGFGILALLLIPLFAGWAYNLFNPSRKFTTWKYIKYAGIITLIGSPLLAYIFDKNEFCYGGAFGNTIVNTLNEITGTLGTGCILIGAFLAAIIGLFNPSLKMPNFANAFAEPAPIKEDTIISNVSKKSLLNNVEETPIHTANGNESKLYIHNSLDEKITEPTPITTNNNALTPEPELEINTTSIIKEEENFEPFDNNNQAVNFDTNFTENKKQVLDENVDLNITENHEEELIPIKNKATVESLDPYDPSLELSNYQYPTIDLLDDRGAESISLNKDELEANKNQIVQTLKNFGIAIARISATVGPTVTLYEIVPADGVRISKIRNLEDDIALSLAALGIRIIAPIPGKGTIGIEVPNLKKQIVSMRGLIASEKFANNNFSLPIAIGKKIDNENYIVDLATMPHMLMAGATGQGKSVGLNAILVSLLYKKHPSQLKFVLVDPKKVELSIYKLIEKHFLAKLPNEEEAIITDTKKVVNTLNSLCIEMDQRYDLLKEAAVRNIKEYNEKFIARRLNPEKGHHYMPFIVLVVDEFADLIMTAGKEVEMPIARLAQLARAIGIHLIIATQRPSVNVITGTIKANFPARIAFRVSAKVDSRTILDAGGAEQLVGKGDLLISNGNELTRVQCAFVDTPEVERIIEFIGAQQGYASAYDLPEYEGADGGDMDVKNSNKSLTDLDQMFEQCARLVVSSGSGSTSMLQRRFNLGYNRAGRIMDQMEAAGIVGPGSGGKPRELYVKVEMELEELLVKLGV